MDAIQSTMDTDEEVSVMKVPDVVFREYRWGIEVIKERGDRRFDNGMLG
jgi:hypothetical protein